MIYYLVVGISGLLLASSLIFFRSTFFNLVERTTSLLNTMLDTKSSDDEKQAALVGRLSGLLISLLETAGVILLTAGLTLAPIFLYGEVSNQPMDRLDVSSLGFYLALSIGSIPPFMVIGRGSEKKDYSDWSKLLHRIILDNYNISKSLFSLEKRIFKPKPPDTGNFIIVTGLARSGTTALTTILDSSSKIYSLSYSNMPFLLSPKIWGKIYKPKPTKLRERSHGDKVLFGHNTVEALEEYFWKVFLGDSFINEKFLGEHQVSEQVYNEYLQYHLLLRPQNSNGSTYMAKNNNFILRYKSIRTFNHSFVIILLFREPVSHAHSLLTQHKRYKSLQDQDSFVKEYMDWLGHHEFGNNHKWFRLGGKEFRSEFPEDTINYWIEIWINYYSYVLTLAPDNNLILVDYQDFLEKPNQLLPELEKSMRTPLNLNEVEKFNKSNKVYSEVDPQLRVKAEALYHKLKQIKLKVASA